MKILEAPSEVPDDAQVTLKSETSHLDQEQKSKELEGKSQKESEPGRLTRLIKFTTGEARELTKHCIQLPHNRGYQLQEHFWKELMVTLIRYYHHTGKK